MIPVLGKQPSFLLHVVEDDIDKFGTLDALEAFQLLPNAELLMLNCASCS